MISTNEFKRGIKIEYRDEPYEVLDFQHVKMGRGAAFVRAKLKGLRTGKTVEETFRSEEHTSELQSHSFISYAVFCLKKKIS